MYIFKGGEGDAGRRGGNESLTSLFIRQLPIVRDSCSFRTVYKLGAITVGNLIVVGNKICISSKIKRSVDAL